MNNVVQSGLEAIWHALEAAGHALWYALETIGRFFKHLF